MSRRRWPAAAAGAIACAALTVPAQAFAPGDRITKNGLGDIAIGMTVAQVEEELGGQLELNGDAAGDGSCRTGALGRKVFGLFAGDVLARVYVNTSRYRTRKGIHVGDTTAEVQAAYGRRLRSRPHFYVQGGRYLTVTTGRRRILFETSAGGHVTSISAGRIPEVDYIEGCA